METMCTKLSKTIIVLNDSYQEEMSINCMMKMIWNKNVLYKAQGRSFKFPKRDLESIMKRTVKVISINTRKSSSSHMIQENLRLIKKKATIRIKKIQLVMELLRKSTIILTTKAISLPQTPFSRSLHPFLTSTQLTIWDTRAPQWDLTWKWLITLTPTNNHRKTVSKQFIMKKMTNSREPMEEILVQDKKKGCQKMRSKITIVDMFCMCINGLLWFLYGF